MNPALDHRNALDDPGTLGSSPYPPSKVMVDLNRLVPVAQMRGEDAEESVELKAMYERARAYLSAHHWCQSIAEAHLGFGVGGVTAIFLFRVKLNTGIDEWLWAVEGDLPSAYMVTDQASTADAALRVYADLMQEWTDAVRKGKDLDDVFPVDAPADEEHADLLDSRIKFLRSDIIPAAVYGVP